MTPCFTSNVVIARWWSRTRCCLVLVAAGAIAAGCDDEASDGASGARTAAAPTAPMRFNVDPTLIGPVHRFESFNVQLAPPAGWQPLPDDQMATVAAAIAKANAQDALSLAGTGEQEGAAATPAHAAQSLPVEPLAVFASSHPEMWLIVSAVDVADAGAFEAALRDAHDVKNAERFAVSDIEVHQYLVRPAKLVNLKLLLSVPGRKDRRYLQLDYIFPEEEFSQSGRTLESSLGSIRPIGQNGA